MSLEKVLIITPVYPPSNVTAANRASSWARYLHKFGYYPIVFCRNFINSDQCYIEKNEFFEVHHINYKDNYIYNKRISIKNKMIRRIFGFIDYLFENSIRYNGIKHMEVFISKYIAENQVEKMIATAPYFSIFGLAHRLSRKHKMKWIADYRDDWTSTDLYSNFSFRLKNRIDHWREKRYLSNCCYFTTVSGYYVDKISGIIHKKGYLVENGFEPDENAKETKLNNNNNNKLTILYPGILYETQKLNIIGDALDLLGPDLIEKIKLTFLGTEIINLRIPINLKRYVDKNVFFMKRLDRKVANQFLNNTDLLLFIAHQASKPIKGIPSSKLYDFIRLKKQVLVCPTDHDIVEEKLKATGQGIFCNTAHELADSINKLINTKREMGSIPLIAIPDDIYFSNTREFQTGKLAKVLDII